MANGIVFDIKRFALHDGPGTRTTIFLKGCPLKCRWCHNPEGITTEPRLLHHFNRCILCGECVASCENGSLKIEENRLFRLDTCNMCGVCVEVCPTGAWEISGKTYTSQDVIKLIERDYIFYDESYGGVTFSGGEPLFQIDFLEDLLIQSRQHGFHTAVDTSGFAPFEYFRRIVDHTNLFLYDIKCLDENKHREFTGVSNRIILENLCGLSGMAGEIIIRVPVIPGFNKTCSEIAAIGKFVQRNTDIKRIDLLPFHSMAREKYARLGMAYSFGLSEHEFAPTIDELRNILVGEGFQVLIGG